MKNSRKTALLLTSGVTAPTISQQFITDSAVVVNPQTDDDNYKVLTGSLGGGNVTYTDANKVTLNQSLSHIMIASNPDGTSLATPPQYGEALKICGFTETIDTATAGQETVTYTNTQSPAKGSVTVYQDGHKFSATNSVVGSLTIDGQAGRKMTMGVALQGYYDNAGIPVVEATPTLPTKDNTSQVGFTTVDLVTFDGTAVTADAFRINMNPEIGNTYATGTKEFNIDDYSPTIEVDFFTTNANYLTAFNDRADKTVKEIIIQTNKDASGNMVSGKSIQIKASRASVAGINDGDTDNKIKRTLTFNLGLDGSQMALEIKQGYFA